MKPAAKAEARRLRSIEDVWSLKKIAKHLQVSVSSVSLWVRDIELTDAQKTLLADRSINGQRWRENRLAVRMRQQVVGRNRAQEETFSLHMAGCMLYWAEGAKNRARISLANSDPVMIALFVKFLRECYTVSDERISVHCAFYTDGDLGVSDIEDYWLEVTQLPRERLRKSTINPDAYPGKKYAKGVRRSLALYGTCTVSVDSTDLAQQVFGAIQQYAGIESTEHRWLG